MKRKQDVQVPETQSSTSTNSTSPDQAALLGVVLTGVVSISNEDGPFDLLSFIIGIMLFVVLIAYWDHSQQRKRKRAAFSAVSAFCGVLILGFPMEAVLSVDFLNRYIPFLGVGSDIRGLAITVLWFVLYILFWVVSPRLGKRLGNGRTS